MLPNDDDFSLIKLFTPITSLRAIIFIIIIGFIVFSNSLFNSFVYDDYLQIVSNPIVQSLNNVHYFFQGGTFFDPGTNQIISIFYRPILSTAFTFLYSIGGNNPFIFHLFQLSLHITNACLVFLLFRKFFKDPLSFFLALVFLIHPINQEAVVYISDLQDNLFVFFGLVALLIASSSKKLFTKVFLVNTFLLLGLLSKETAILFVPMVFVYQFLFKKNENKKPYLFSIFLITGVYLYIRFMLVNVVPITNALIPIMQASLTERLLTVPEVIFYYLKTFFFPYQLALGHLWVVKTPSVYNFYLPLLLDSIFLLSIFIFGLKLKKVHNDSFYKFIFFFLWFILGLGMHSQIIPLEVTVADRWFYFTSIGLIGIIGICIDRMLVKKINKNLLITLGIIIILLLSIRTMVRNTNWINAVTLCQHDLNILQDSYNVESSCGSELLKLGKYNEAKQYYGRAAILAPTWSSNWYQYGLSYEYTHDISQARNLYRKSIEHGGEVNAYISLAATYLKYAKNPTEAKKIVEEGLKKYPNYQRLQLYIAVCEYELNNKDKALQIAEQIYQSAPTPEAKYVLQQIANNQKIMFE